MLEDSLNENLDEEKLVLRIIVIFMILSSLVGWLGLRAFAAYVGEMKHKEYKSKKIIGASPSQIFSDFFMSISQFVLMGILTGIPLSYIVVSLWLNGFAYISRLPLILMFAVAAIVWGISFLLILIHSGKSIKSSPANS